MNRGGQAGHIGARLRERVLESVFPQLAAGFGCGAGGSEASDEALEELFQGTLVLLYRLLFLLCAEARGLLPVQDEKGYHEVSLTRLKCEVAAVAGSVTCEVEGRLKKRYREDSYCLYNRLTKLFRTIARGDAALSVHTYPGSLFLSGARGTKDGAAALAQSARFLRSHKIPDRHLARALDLLAREVCAESGVLVFVDYGSLDVRWLGSIYEGLLERRLRVANRRLCVSRARGGERCLDFDELEAKTRTREARRGRLIEKGQLYLEQDRRERRATGSYYTPDYIVSYLVEQTVGPILEEKLKAVAPRLRVGTKRSKDKACLLDELFDLKVLDPACGPGHFLVAAVDYIAARMLAFLKALGGKIGGRELTDLALLKREVLKRCIYGVDSNPVAVELAKLSLWLGCSARRAPLPFLDHHLRCGNSLIGASVQEVREAFEDGKSSRLLSATELMRRASEMAEPARGEAELCRAAYRKARRTIRPLKRMLDRRTGQWFGDGAESKAKSFFHWGLEFPEVSAGFDAVIGNPPWGAKLAPDEKKFYRERFQSVATGRVDSFALFIERCTNLARREGRIGLLLPDIILLKNYPAARRYILFNQQISQIVHWGQPFTGVNLDVCSIVSARKQRVADHVPLKCVVNVTSWEAGKYVRNVLTHGSLRRNDAYKFNLFLNDELRKRLAVVTENSETLSAFLEFHEGIHSGNVRGKLFVDECAGTECQPLIFGGDEVQPFALCWKGRHVVYDRSIINRAKGEYANLGREPYFANPKLLVRRTGDRIIAAADYNHFFASNNLFVAQARSGVTIPLEFFEGLLNSDFSTWYFRTIQPRQGRLFSELKIVHLSSVPVPRAALTEHLAEIVSLVESLRGGLNLRRGDGACARAAAYAKLNRIFVGCAGLRESGGAS